MADATTTSSRRWRLVANAPLMALAVLVVLVDDAFRAAVVPAVRALARLQPVRRLEARIAALPPKAILLLFVVPLAVIEPFKVYALLLIGQGHFVSAALVFVAAKVVGLGLAERLFAIGRDKLLSIGWFARCHAFALRVRNMVHRWLQRVPAWQTALRLVARIRTGLRGARATLVRVLSGRRRLAAAHRLAKRGWAR